MMDENNTEYPRSNATRGIGGINIPAKIENNIFSHCINEALIGIDVYDDKWDFNEVKQSVGAGLRWMSPMGPMRLEWGYVINPKPGENTSNWEFSMGGAF